MNGKAQMATEILQNPTVNKAVSGGTIAIWFSFDWLPAWAESPVEVVAFIGGILSAVLIVSNTISVIHRWKLNKLELEIAKLEIKALKERGS